VALRSSAFEHKEVEDEAHAGVKRILVLLSMVALMLVMMAMKEMMKNECPNKR
jgi:hypothetical protein